MKPPRIAKTPLRHVRRERPDMSPAHKRNIKDLPCCVCGAVSAIDPHHLMHPDHGPNSRGMGRTSADKWLVPLCRTHHDEAHAYRFGDDSDWLATQGIMGKELATALWSDRDDIAAMLRHVLRAIQGARLKRMGPKTPGAVGSGIE